MKKFEQLARRIECDIFKEHGPMVSGKSLSQLLGYPSYDAFRQALVRKKVPVPIFTLGYRRGKFALVSEIAMWLAEQRLTSTINENKED